MKYPALELAAIRDLDFPVEQYYRQETEKKQICLHHTASGKGIDGDYRWWLSDPRRVATCMIIDYDGKINRLFSDRYWGHHLGLQLPNNTELNRACIGVEIDSWGPLLFINGAYRSYLGSPVPKEEVVEYPNGFKTLPGGTPTDPTYFGKMKAAGLPAYHYQRYSDEQILSVAKLLEYWNVIYKIPTTYRPEMWDVSKDALSGQPGVWTHVSYRHDKQDCHPQPELISMLKSLNPSI